MPKRQKTQVRSHRLGRVQDDEDVEDPSVVGTHGSCGFLGVDCQSRQVGRAKLRQRGDLTAAGAAQGVHDGPCCGQRHSIAMLVAMVASVSSLSLELACSSRDCARGVCLCYSVVEGAREMCIHCY